LPAFQANHRDADVVADKEPLHQLPGQHQHVSRPKTLTQEVNFQITLGSRFQLTFVVLEGWDPIGI
jgi:hypothetical protein